MVKIISILLYFFIFGISFSCFKNYSNGTNKERYLYLFFGCILLCCFAAFRSLDVGTDTHNYYNLFIEALKSENFAAFLKTTTIDEFLYNFLLYFVAKIFENNYWVFSLAIAIIQVIFAVEIAKKFSNKAPFEITMLFFMTLYFTIGFNISRSITAALIFLYGCLHLYKKKVLPFLIFSTLAFMFHSSILFGLICFLFVEALSFFKKKWLKRVLIFAAGFLIVCFCFNLFGLTIWLFSNSGINTGKYDSYYGWMTGIEISSSTSSLIVLGQYAFFELLFRILFVAIPFALTLKQKERVLSKFRVYSVFSLVIYSSIFLGFNTVYGYRLTVTLDLFNILYFSYVYNILSKKHKMKNTLITIPFLYFVIIFGYCGAHDILPYSFYGF